MHKNLYKNCEVSLKMDATIKVVWRAAPFTRVWYNAYLPLILSFKNIAAQSDYREVKRMHASSIFHATRMACNSVGL